MIVSNLPGTTVGVKYLPKTTYPVEYRTEYGKIRSVLYDPENGIRYTVQFDNGELLTVKDFQIVGHCECV